MTKLILRLGLVFLLFVIYRLFEGSLYEPFRSFYNAPNSGLNIDQLNYVSYSLGIILRFILNSAISLLGVYLIFRSKNYSFWAVRTFLATGLLLIPVYLWMCYTDFPLGATFAYNVRRILVFPIVFLVLLGSFYYDSKKNV
ncbi:MAG: exosortase F system-associated membrane protein [Flavobacteriaceae bacterium]